MRSLISLSESETNTLGHLSNKLLKRVVFFPSWWLKMPQSGYLSVWQKKPGEIHIYLANKVSVMCWCYIKDEHPHIYIHRHTQKKENIKSNNLPFTNIHSSITVVFNKTNHKEIKKLPLTKHARTITGIHCNLHFFFLHNLVVIHCHYWFFLLACII